MLNIYYLASPVITFLYRILLDDAFLYEDLLQDLDSLLYLILGMSSHEGETYQCILWCTCWRNNRVDEHTCIISHLGNHEGLLCIANIERNDRTLCLTNLETFLAETLQCLVGYIPEILETLWLILNDVECLECCCCSCWSVGCTEDVGTAVVTEEVDGILV